MDNHRYSSPAKVNRFLHITGRRSDGYHTIHTLFQFLQLEDSLSFSIRQDGVIERIDNHSFALPEIDLSIEAANALKDKSNNQNLGVTISLNKNIPPGSGMGGGSSNAATTLVALNHLWQLNLSNAELQQIGLQLGADVPIFVYGKAAFATGIGEQFIPYNALENWLCLVVPDIHVSTAKIFTHAELKRDGKKFTPQDYAEQETCNHLEDITRKLYPKIDGVFNTLEKFGTPRMNGSGCSIFLSCESKNQAEQIKRQLPSDWRVIVTKALNSHSGYT